MLAESVDAELAAGAEADAGWSAVRAGALLREAGEQATAIELFEKGLTLLQSRGASRRLFDAQNTLGIALEDAGRREEAQKMLASATETARVLGDDSALAIALGNEATLHWRQGRLGVAEALMAEGIDLARRTNDTGTLGTTLKDYAGLLESLDERDKAANVYQELAGYGGSLRIDAGIGLGWLAYRRKDFAEALVAFRSAADRARGSGAQEVEALGGVVLSLAGSVSKRGLRPRVQRLIDISRQSSPDASAADFIARGAGAYLLGGVVDVAVELFAASLMAAAAMPEPDTFVFTVATLVAQIDGAGEGRAPLLRRLVEHLDESQDGLGLGLAPAIYAVAARVPLGTTPAAEGVVDG
jgi:tetratricopeptide (TPR) repeat protein